MTSAEEKLLAALNEFCFHGDGDDCCIGCRFKDDDPCPVAELCNRFVFMNK